MFIAIYSFKVIPGKTNEFIASWKALTELIYDHEGSLGSRLHKESDDTYIAYAQWPNKKTWEESGDHLPASAQDYRQMMRYSCSEINTIHQLEVIEDLLADQPKL